VPRLPQDFNFEPSLDTKKFYFWTRKSQRKIGGVVLPGLFSTSGVVADAFLFSLILGAEFLGLMNLYSVSDGKIKILSVVALVIADFLFAFFLHLPWHIRLEAMNREVLAIDEREQALYRMEQKKFAWLAPIFKIFIWLIALFKVASFWAFRGIFDGPTVAILLSYCVVALLHIYCTGFFLSELWLNWQIRREFRIYIDSRNPERNKYRTGIRARLIECKNPMKRSAVAQHVFDEEQPNSSDTPSIGVFVLKTKGILTDGQLYDIVRNQDTREARMELAVKLLEHQMDIMLSDPQGIATGTQNVE